MKRGTKPTSKALKVLRGTFQPCRARTATIAPLEGEVVVPRWLTGLARQLWTIKAGTYARRGQSVVGCEAALAQYCRVEADLIDRWRKGREVPVALINAHRIYANEFYDTPASQQAAGSQATASNRFARNGRAPDRPARG